MWFVVDKPVELLIGHLSAMSDASKLVPGSYRYSEVSAFRLESNIPKVCSCLRGVKAGLCLLDCRDQCVNEIRIIENDLFVRTLVVEDDNASLVVDVDCRT